LNYVPTISDQTVFIWPYVKGVYTINVTNGAYNVPVVAADTFSAISNMYLMYRGGARIMYYSNGTGPTFVANDVNTAISATSGNSAPIGVVTQQFIGVTPVYGFNGYSSHAVNVQDSSDGVCFASVPYYARTKATLALNAFLDQTDNFVYDPSNSLNVLNFYRPTDTNCAFWRSFPDEFQCTYFIGAPPKVESYA